MIKNEILNQTNSRYETEFIIEDINRLKNEVGSKLQTKEFRDVFDSIFYVMIDMIENDDETQNISNETVDAVKKSLSNLKDNIKKKSNSNSLKTTSEDINNKSINNSHDSVANLSLSDNKEQISTSGGPGYDPTKIDKFINIPLANATYAAQQTGREGQLMSSPISTEQQKPNKSPKIFNYVPNLNLRNSPPRANSPRGHSSSGTSSPPIDEIPKPFPSPHNSPRLSSPRSPSKRDSSPTLLSKSKENISTLLSISHKKNVPNQTAPISTSQKSDRKSASATMHAHSVPSPVVNTTSWKIEKNQSYSNLPSTPSSLSSTSSSPLSSMQNVNLVKIEKERKSSATGLSEKYYKEKEKEKEKEKKEESERKASNSSSTKTSNEFPVKNDTLGRGESFIEKFSVNRKRLIGKEYSKKSKQSQQQTGTISESKKGLETPHNDPRSRRSFSDSIKYDANLLLIILLES
jgi:hypothetical protein